MKELLNLQLFAVQTTLLNNKAGGNDLSPEMKTYYEKRLIDNAEPELVHDQFGDDYPIPKNGGKTIEMRKYSSLPKAMTPITEGVTPNGNKLNVTIVEATVDQYGDYIQMSDMLEMTAIDNNVVQATKLLGSQAGRTLDTVTREKLNAGTNRLLAKKSDGTQPGTRAAMDATCTLTVDTVKRAVRILKNGLAQKINGSYVGIIHPDNSYVLTSDPAFIDIHKYSATEELFEGEIGKIAGVRFVETTEAKIWDSTNCGTTACPSGLAVYSTLILGAHAYGKTSIEGGGLQHILKNLGYGDDPLNQRSSCGWKATKTAEILTEEYMVRIESCNEFSATATAN